MKKEQVIWDNMAKAFHITSSRSKAHRDKYLEIADWIIEVAPKKILDLGCGSGILEKELTDRNFLGKILAIDISEPMLKIARSIVQNPNICFKKADLDSPFMLGKKFDIIISINLLFFLDNKIDFLKNVKSCLKTKKSRFIMITPKPNEETNNLEFIKEHFKNTTFWEKFIIIINELFNIPIYFKMLKEQNKINKLAETGIIVFDTPKKIEYMAKEAGLVIIFKKSIHVNQNWLYVFRRV